VKSGKNTQQQMGSSSVNESLSNCSHYSTGLEHLFLFNLPGATPSSQFKASFILILTLVHILWFQCIFVWAIILISILNSNSGLFSFVPSFCQHCLSAGFPTIDASTLLPPNRSLILVYAESQECSFKDEWCGLNCPLELPEWMMLWIVVA
jgi:hypothetical protein